MLSRDTNADEYLEILRGVDRGYRWILHCVEVQDCSRRVRRLSDYVYRIWIRTTVYSEYGALIE